MESKKVVKNAGWIIGLQILKSLLTLIVGMLTARYLGPANYGLINYAASIVAFVSPFMYLGLSDILVQEIVKYPQKEGETLGTAVGLSFLASVVCIIGVVAFTKVANPGEMETTIVCVLYSILLIFQSLDLIQYWFQAKLLSKYSSVVSLVAYLFVSIYKVILLVTGKNIRWFAIANAVDYMIISAGLYIVYYNISHTRLSFSKYSAMRMLQKSKYYILANLMVVIFAQTDKIMLKIMTGNEASGYYAAALTCSGVTGFVFSAIIDSYRPLIFENKNKSERQYEHSICSLYSVIIYGALLQSLILSICSGIIVSILYGEMYQPAVGVLRLITWFSTFSYLGAVRNIWMLAEKKQQYLWVINLSGAFANVLMNFILIPIWGMYGAAIASLVTQVFTNVIVGFIISPIRNNNKLMMDALNPKYILEVVKLVFSFIRTKRTQ